MCLHRLLLKVYYSLVHSHLSYAIAGGGGAADIHLRPLNSLQNRAIKMLPGSDDEFGYVANGVLPFINVCIQVL